MKITNSPWTRMWAWVSPSAIGSVLLQERQKNYTIVDGFPQAGNCRRNIFVPFLNELFTKFQRLLFRGCLEDGTQTNRCFLLEFFLGIFAKVDLVLVLHRPPGIMKHLVEIRIAGCIRKRISSAFAQRATAR